MFFCMLRYMLSVPYPITHEMPGRRSRLNRDINSDSLYHDIPMVEDSALQRDLEAAQKAIRNLLREADKAQQRYDQLSRAYRLTVDNLVKTTSECSALERELEQCKQRGGRAEPRDEMPSFNTGALTLSLDEVAAVRKAMARLHHPDAGGDAERMKAWNALLDTLEQRAGS